MVTEWGMSDKLGMIAYGENSQEVFLGHSVTQSKNLSESTAQAIDGEIKRIIDEAYATAMRVVTERRDGLDQIAKALLEFETLSGDEIKGLLAGEPIVRKPVDDTPAADTRRSSVPTTGRVPKSGGAPGGFDPAPQPNA
jgi:cell division protease FtsH